MSETATKPRKDITDLSSMAVADLRKTANNLGIEGAADMKKADLVKAIGDLQAANREAARLEREAKREERMARRQEKLAKKDSRENESEGSDQEMNDEFENDNSGESGDRDRSNRGDLSDRGDRGDRSDRGDRGDRGGRFDRRDRFRRDRGREREIVLSEDDVLIPVSGLLDILENYAFLRTSGYLPGPQDVYVSLQQVRRYGLRKGDVITGAVREPRDNERREKFNALVKIETVNGMDPDGARDRVEFAKLVPLYPQDRLRLETEPNILTTRVIDLVAPIGKGQRGLIVSPPKAGKTMVLQAIANAIRVRSSHPPSIVQQMTTQQSLNLRSSARSVL